MTCMAALLALMRETGHGHDPVRLPRAALVRRERLLPARGGLRDAGPDEAHDDGSPVELVPTLEDADPVREAPDDRRIERALLIAGPVNAPLARAGVVEPEGEAHEARPVVGDVLVHVAEAAGQKPGAVGGLERLPLRAAGE